MLMRLSFIAVGFIFGVCAVSAMPQQPQSSVALQIAKRVAQLQITQNAPSRGLKASRRVVANEKRLTPMATR